MIVNRSDDCQMLLWIAVEHRLWQYTGGKCTGRQGSLTWSLSSTLFGQPQCHIVRSYILDDSPDDSPNESPHVSPNESLDKSSDANLDEPSTNEANEAPEIRDFSFDLQAFPSDQHDLTMLVKWSHYDTFLDTLWYTGVHWNTLEYIAIHRLAQCGQRLAHVGSSMRAMNLPCVRFWRSSSLHPNKAFFYSTI